MLLMLQIVKSMTELIVVVLIHEVLRAGDDLVHSLVVVTPQGGHGCRLTGLSGAYSYFFNAMFKFLLVGQSFPTPEERSV